MQEEWRPVVGYEGLYEISNLGRVKSVERDIDVTDRYGHSYKYHVKEKIMKQGRRNDGYADVSLSSHGVTTLHCVHRLLAEAWIPNPYNLQYVNHKDLNKTNNSISNLEWVSNSENMRHANINYANNQSIPIYCLETDEVYAGMAICDRALGFSEGTTHDVIRNNKSCNYHLSIASEDQITEAKRKIKSECGWTFSRPKKGRLHPIRKIKCIDNQCVYESLSDLSRKLNLVGDSVRDAIRNQRTYKGLTFYYLDDSPEDELVYAEHCKKRYYDLTHSKGKRLV